MHHPIDRITHTTTFVTQVVVHWLKQERAQWVVMCYVDITSRPLHVNQVLSTGQKIHYQ